ncbi:MAG TPA: tetratricopeptide repeat protein [Nitrospirota bacterium]
MKKALLARFLLIFILSLVFGPQPADSASAASQQYSKANKLFSAGKFPDAIELYKGVLAKPSDDVNPGDVYTRIGDSYFRLQDYRNALAAYRGALTKQKRTERAPTQYWIGFCTLLSGRDEEAVAEFLKIPEYYPTSGMWVGTAYYWAGRASERLGKKAEAAEYYRKAAGKGKSTQERFALKKANTVKSK